LNPVKILASSGPKSSWLERIGISSLFANLESRIADM